MTKTRTPRKLKLEILEDRKLMAGNVTAGIESNDLWIRGDNRDNVVEIRQLANPGQFRVIGLSGTTINGRSQVDITSPTTDMHIRMNGGNDGVVIGSFTVATRQARIEDLTVDMGTGSDAFFMNNVAVTDKVDDAIITMGGTENESDGVYLFDTQFNANARISTGGGNDVVSLNRVDTRRQLNVQTGAGNDRVELIDSVFASSMIDGGAGTDELVRRRSSAASFRNFERYPA
jgi:hypothetical protein